jgi:tellurite resistance protein
MNVAPEIARRIERLVRRFAVEEIPVLLDLLVLVAQADNKLAADEHIALAAGLQGVIGDRLAAEEVTARVGEAMDAFVEEGMDLRALAVGHRLAELGKAEEGLRVAIAVALATGALRDAEQDLMGTIARAAGVSGARVEVLIEHVRDGLSLDA